MFFEIAAYYLAFMTLVTLAICALDNFLSHDGNTRIPDPVFVWVSLAGGWFGVKLGQLLLRHRSTTTGFSWRFNLLPLAWVGVFCVAAGVYSAPDDMFASKKPTSKFFTSAQN